MSQDQENNTKRERINAMKNKITINESDSDSITVTGTEKNKVKVNEQDRKKVELSELNLLTPDEKEKLAKEKGKDTTKEKVGKVYKGDGDRAKADWKRDKLIEYTDIIDFLFKEIIVEGLDWSLNKVVNAATFTTAWAVDGTLNAASHAKDSIWDDIKSYLEKQKRKTKAGRRKSQAP